MEQQTKRLYRSRYNKTLAGVCGGVAEYFGFDPTIVRLAWVVLTLIGGSGILLYIIAYFVMPENPNHNVPESASHKTDFTAGKIIGIVLMFIGFILLLDNLDIFSFHSFWFRSWDYVIPIMLVLGGIALLMKKERVVVPPVQEPAEPGAGSDIGQSYTENQSPQQKQLRRSVVNKKIFGICGGLGEYFAIDPTIVRLVYVVFTLMSCGTGMILYVLMYFIIPEDRSIPAQSK